MAKLIATIFVAIFVIAFGFIAIAILTSIATCVHNAFSPRLAKEAHVIGKRLYVSGGQSYTSTQY